MSTTTSTTPAHRATPTITEHPFRAVVTRSVMDRLPLVLIVGVLMIGMGLLVGALWPSLQDTFADLEDSLPEAFTTVLGGVSMGTPVGWANAEMISLVAPLGAIAIAVIAGTAATAGEEESKTLGVLISTPIRRRSVVLAKTVAMVVLTALVGVFVYLGLLAGSALGDMGLTQQGMLGASVHVAAIGVLFGAVAILVGAATGARRVTTAASAGLALLAFATASFLPLSESLADGVKASPWYYFNESVPLANGIEWPHLLILAGASVVLVLVSLPVFRARDLRG
ncbi:MAG: ABC transporter permease subunit [Ornithinimicrobium sp.]